MFRTVMSGIAGLIVAACSMTEQQAAVQQPLRQEVALAEPEVLAKAQLATFYGFDAETGASYSLKPELTRERFPPYSTFKIPNFLIALDSGAVSGPEVILRWEPEKRPREEHWPNDWARDHSLASAYKASAVWFFRDVASRVGSARYKAYLRQFGYGNETVPEGSDNFWLGGSLAISPREQVTFLKQLGAGELDVAPTAVEALKAAALVSRHGQHKLFGKTGAGPVDPTRMNGSFGGWLVGWVERPERKPFYYAFYMRAGDFRTVSQSRTEAALLLLKQASALPSDWH